MNDASFYQSIDTSNMYIIDYVKNGDLQNCKRLIEEGTDVNVQDEWYTTALMFAVEKGHTDIVKFLIGAGADVNHQDHDGYAALMIAAEKGHSEIVQLLIKASADVDSQNGAGTTALIIAAEYGYTECVKLLLENGAEVDLEERLDDRTALMEAADRGRSQICQILIEHGADVNLKNHFGTALKMALFDLTVRTKITTETVLDGHESTETVQLLIQAGANYENVKDQDVFKTILKKMKEDLCNEFLQMDERYSNDTRESWMNLEYEELKAMVEGHPSRLNLSDDEPDFEIET